MDADLLAETQAAITSAIENGTTFNDFQKRLKPYLMAKGWWGQQVRIDPADNQAKLVQLGSTRRLKTIFDVNMRTAAAAGQWQRFQRTKKHFPYIKYLGSTAANKRKEHESYRGLVLPIDAPFWTTHLPPNGYNCQCKVRNLTQKQAEREGISESPDIDWIDYTNPRTGKTYTVPADVHPSFAHNHADRLTALDTVFAEKHGKQELEILTRQREYYLNTAVNALINKSVFDLTHLPKTVPQKEIKRLAPDADHDGKENIAEAIAAAKYQQATGTQLQRFDKARGGR